MKEKSESRWVKVCVVENRFEADRVGEALEEERIPYWIKDYQDTAYDGIYISRKGWGSLWVPEEWESHARRVVEELKKAFAET